MTYARWFALPLLVISSFVTAAAPPLGTLPDTLKDWTDWVQYDTRHRACPLMAGGDIDDDAAFVCAWPGRLELDAGDAGAAFTQSWTLYADGAVPLPGNQDQWPQQVRVDGAAAAVVAGEDARPTLWLPAGTHRVEGRLQWSERPESIAVDARVARIALAVDGRAIFPIQHEGGALWLGRAERVAAEADSLDVQVFRMLSDQVPQRLVTRIRLQASGKGREESLASVLPPDFVPVALSGDLVARYEADGSLHVQVRPGTHVIELIARAARPIAALTFAARPAPWPASEVWSYEGQPQLRVTDAAGPPQIDPVMAEVPQEWRALPAFEMSDGATLSVTERSRGMSDQDQNRLTLSRELWLDYAGDGWTSKDQINGKLQRGWRLDLAAPYQLTRASENGLALLITRGAADGTTGVEVRERNLALSASARIESGTGTLPLTGWLHPFESVSTSLNFPPGYELVAAPGADRAPQAWLDRWNLLEVFIAALTVFLCALAFGRVAALVPLGYVLLAWHLGDAPRYALLIAVGMALLAGAVTQGEGLKRWLARFARLAAIVLVVIAVPFAAQQIRQALYPQLESTASGYDYGMLGGYADKSVHQAEPMPASAPMVQQDAYPATEMEATLVTGSAAGGEGNVGRMQKSVPQKFRRALRRYESNIVVQAGGGEPAWRWRQYDLEIAGPVVPAQSVRLLISPPWMTRLARVLIVLLLGATLTMVLRRTFLPRRPAAAAPLPASAVALAVALALTSPVIAAEVPSPELLDTLRERVTALPACAPDCGYIARADVRAQGTQIVAALELHAAEQVALPMPGNASLLDLESLRLDGVEAGGSVRDDDGTLWLVLPRGVHRAELQWRAANADSISLRFAMAPGWVAFSGDGWEASGIDDGQLATGSLELTRQAGGGDVGSRAGLAQNFPAFVVVTRDLRFDLDWSITTTVQRLSPATSAFSVAVPLLEGEHVMSTGFAVERGVVTAPFGEGQDQVSWESRLDAVDALTLTAPEQGARSEIWRFDVSPTWNVTATGVPGVHPASGMYQFHPLPGETLTLAIKRPDAVKGNTIAIDRASLDSHVGRRSSEHRLEISLRATQGGQHAIQLPADAEVMELDINGRPVNVRPLQGVLALPIAPGANAVAIRWRDPQGATAVTRTPAIALNADASNLSVSMALPEQRWLIATRGPRVGPAVLYWGELVVMLLLAWAVSRSRRTPLTFTHWLLLGIGFSTSSWWALLLFAAWLFALDWRSRVTPDRLRWWFNFAQLGIVVLTLIAGVALVFSIQNGLLGSPDLHVTGNGSWSGSLRWFHDQTNSAMPVGVAYSLPMWLYRALMLAWAFWMAWALIRWVRWGAAAFTHEGAWYRGARAKVPTMESPAPATSESEPPRDP